MVNLIFMAEQAVRGLSKSVGHEKTSAIILVAGKSTRVGGNTTKQLTEINGIPVAVHTLRKFQKSEVIDEIIIVASASERELYDDYIKEYGLTKVTKVIEGGESRAESAKKGFFATDKKSKYVAIHDGARCAVSLKQIEDVVREAYRSGAAIAAARSTDTVKRADKEGFIAKTIDRRYIWRAQTPQVFLRKMYEVALAKAGDKYIYATDDASLAEAAGFKVKLVECSDSNIKITYAEDFMRVKHILDAQEETEK
ncbi:MAG: 2-C-methyl-D-erythritol 4-phosphate cytidylyltransferase [Clostridia bacterium]|nr:2-C-methyl-D-erythritol 4-phosphate cytidylyltransferase [Clostridia bacterium]